MIVAFSKNLSNYFLKKLEIQKSIFDIINPFYYFMRISGCACFTIDLISDVQTVKVTIIDYAILFCYISVYIYFMILIICFRLTVGELDDLKNSDIEIFGTHFIHAVGYVISVISILLLFQFRLKRFKIIILFNEINNLFLLLGLNVKFGFKWMFMYSYLFFQFVWFLLILNTSFDFKGVLHLFGYLLPNIIYFVTYSSAILLCMGILSKLNRLNDYISGIFLKDSISQNPITILVSAHDKIAEALTLINFCYGFQILLFFCLCFMNTLFVIFGVFQDVETISIVEALTIINLTIYNNSYSLEIIYISHRITNMVNDKILNLFLGKMIYNITILFRK